MDGTLNITDDGYELRFERRLSHPVNRVWQALIDPAERAVWFFAGTLEPRVGGRVDLEDSSDGVMGTVTAIEPPRLLEFTWSSQDGPSGRVRFELRDEGASSSVLTFTHATGADARPESLLAGWHYIFDDLPRYLDGEPVESIPGRYASLREKYSQVAGR